VQKQPSRLRKWIVAGIKLLVALAVIWWVEDTIVAGWHQLREQDQGLWEWRPVWLVIAGGIYALAQLPFAMFWFRVLHVLGQRPRLFEALRAYYIGHLGKYVPGKAMVVILRAGLVRSERVDAGVAAAAVFLETLTMMAVGGFLAAGYLLLFFRDEPAWAWAAVGLMAVALLPTLPPIFRRLVRLARVGRRDPDATRALDRLGFGTLLMGWMLDFLGWVLMALSYYATLQALGIEGIDPVADLPRFAAGVALAVVAGFLLLILPGGFGVREAFLVKLMLPYLEGLGRPDAASTAWASAILLRLVWIVVEASISGIMYFVPTSKR
jgi:glycosyltransferase 2 family protein